MAFSNDNNIKISYECGEQIDRLHRHINKFGGDSFVYALIKNYNGVDIYIDFMNVVDDSIKNDSIKMMSATALMCIFKKQNEVL